MSSSQQKCPYCKTLSAPERVLCRLCLFPFRATRDQQMDFINHRMAQVRLVEKWEMLTWLGRLPVFLTFLLLIIADPILNPDRPEPGQEPAKNILYLFALLFIPAGILSIRYTVQVLTAYLVVLPVFLGIATGMQIPPNLFFFTTLFWLAALFGIYTSLQRKKAEKGVIFPWNYHIKTMLTEYYPADADNREAGI